MIGATGDLRRSWVALLGGNLATNIVFEARLPALRIRDFHQVAVNVVSQAGDAAQGIRNLGQLSKSIVFPMLWIIVGICLSEQLAKRVNGQTGDALLGVIVINNTLKAGACSVLIGLLKGRVLYACQSIKIGRAHV